MNTIPSVRTLGVIAHLDEICHRFLERSLNLNSFHSRSEIGHINTFFVVKIRLQELPMARAK
jgi:hypothetical protein